MFTTGECCKNCHLAVIDFAESAKPLTLNAHRHGPFLGNPALVYQKSTVMMATKMLIDLLADLLYQGPFVPRRVRKKVMQGLVV